MSHFTVLVIGENPEEQLAPFQENNMGDCPKEYMKFYVYDEDGNEHVFDSEDQFKSSGVKMGEDGSRWENPNRKWDWYSLGGRWTGYFKMKKGVLAVAGRPGIFTAHAPKGTGDQAQKGDIDFDIMRNEAGLKAQNEYEEMMAIIGLHPANRTWENVRESFEDINEARRYYHDQPRVKALAHSESDMRWLSVDNFLVSKEEYIENARNASGVTFAVIKDGKWYERGDMGWWGMVSDEKDKNSWNREFASLVDNLPDNTLLSVYDCHI